MKVISRSFLVRALVLVLVFVRALVLDAVALVRALVLDAVALVRALVLVRPPNIIIDVDVDLVSGRQIKSDRR